MDEENEPAGLEDSWAIKSDDDVVAHLDALTHMAEMSDVEFVSVPPELYARAAFIKGQVVRWNGIDLYVHQVKRETPRA